MKRIEQGDQIRLNNGEMRVGSIKWKTKIQVHNDGGIEEQIVGVDDISLQHIWTNNPHFSTREVGRTVKTIPTVIPYGEPVVIVKPITKVLPAERTLTNRQRRELRDQMKRR